MGDSGSILGNAVRRIEDPALLTGVGKNVDDLVESHMSNLALVRSHVARGYIRSIDVGDAVSMPGVVAVYHAGDNLGLAPVPSFPTLVGEFVRPVLSQRLITR